MSIRLVIGVAINHGVLKSLKIDTIAKAYVSAVVCVCVSENPKHTLQGRRAGTAGEHCALGFAKTAMCQQVVQPFRFDLALEVDLLSMAL
eukprot:3511580-Amphidinium_carterae.1